MYLEPQVFSKEYLFTIHYLFFMSNNILAQGLEFASIFGVHLRPARAPPPAGVRGRQPPEKRAASGNVFFFADTGTGLPQPAALPPTCGFISTHG